ncbi:hypothetical protein [Streptomyces sp. NPDC059176]|uniref:hypothetical protein n=1 Tax=Streptomyces sp. NPDC059176 TaxID=3346758 RepID=UPI0036A04928
MGTGPAAQWALPATAMTESDTSDPIEAYEQLSATAGTGAASSQASAAAPNSRPTSDPYTSMSMIQRLAPHAGPDADSLVGAVVGAPVFGAAEKNSGTG